MNIVERNNINRIGKGKKTILFSHGYGCDQNMWRFVSPAFKEHYDVILLDLVGSGQSRVEEYDFEKYSTLKGYANDIIEICDTLDLRDIYFVGHSVSSTIGMLAAVKRPELFEKIVMIGPSPCYINNANYYGGFSQQDIDELIHALESNYLKWSSYITPIIVDDPEKPEIIEELRDSFCRNNADIAKHFAKVTFLGDYRDDFEKLTVPTLILQSNPDIIAPIQVGEYLHQKIANSTYALLNASGHCPHLTAPNETINAIQAYIAN